MFIVMTRNVMRQKSWWNKAEADDKIGQQERSFCEQFQVEKNIFSHYFVVKPSNTKNNLNV